FEEWYNDFAPTTDELEAFRSSSMTKILAIAEDWCPDVYNTLGIIARIAEITPGVEIRIFERGSHPEIMDQYFSNGKKRIPAFAFFDSNFREICRWAGRNKAADEFVRDFRKDRPYDQIPPDERKAFGIELNRRYKESYARGNLDEITELLGEVTV